MAKLTQLNISNYRSVSDELELVFPNNAPLVLVGENNAGKSNIVRALELLLGGFWPGNHEPEDNEFFGRDRGKVIGIEATFDGSDRLGGEFTGLRWSYDDSRDQPVGFQAFPNYKKEWGYLKNEQRDTCFCVVIQADRNLRYHLGYSSKWTLLSRLMRRFHLAMLEDPKIVEELKATFAEIKNSFGKVKEYQAFHKNLQDFFTQLVGSMTHKLDVDFEAYNPTNFFQALQLHASEGGSQRSIDEMGTGEQQVLAMAFAHAYARAFHSGIILVIEEPESHLHPLAQEWLAKQFREMAKDGLQLLITTHSAAFVELMNIDGLALVRKIDGSSRVTQRSAADLATFCKLSGGTKATNENVLPFYSVNATRPLREGFFAKAVVLVEGPTESLSLPEYLERVGVLTHKLGISIIAVHGKGSLASWRRLFMCFDIPCYVIFDNDGKSDDETGAKRRDALTAVGLEDAKKIEAILKTDDWIVEDQFAVFGSDFEQVLRKYFSQYSSFEDASRKLGANSKPFVARHVAQELPIDDSDGWSKMKTLGEKLVTLVTSNSSGDN